ncbi:ParB N-terminal domain-containing protein [Phenylobacterium sp. LjRoot225]|uniref:ParB/RepB/Spo0J family partition protein n=1 Tax=Phenylobacterium sp. LjRoot225 TaxID=3342285 RepID=UPI003ECEB42F
MNFREIALNKLVLSPRNMRQGDVFVDDLVANIGATGKVLQNLRVTAEQGEAGKPTGRFEVHVGGRRWRALNVLAERKAIKRTFPVPCAVCEDEAEALEESIAENNVRLPPHPADQFAAFYELSQTGKTVTEIAERFSISPRIVERRLKLATVSPRLMELFRADELTLDHMAAFTLSDDHAAQEAAYFHAPKHSRSPWEIKRRIVGGAISTETNALAKLVGLGAYRAAGGVVSQDLFAQDGDAGFITDIALLERLATEKLDIAAEEVRGEGWSWVELALSWDYSTSQQYGRAYPTPVPLSAEARDEIERLTVEYQTLETETDEDDAEALELMEAIDQRLAELEASAGETYADEVKAITGAIVTVSQSGGVRIERGCAKPGADTKALRALEGQDNGSRGSAYPTQERPKRENGALADKLVLDLSAHRTAAIRASLLDRPDVALVAVTHALLVQTHYGCAVYDRPTTFELSADTLTNHPQRHCQGYQGSKAGQVLTSARGRMTLLLPTSSRELWGYLMERSQNQLLELLAYAASNLVNGLVASHNQVNTDRVRAADALACALALNMTDWWEATAESFFGRVSKPVILAAVAEVSTAQAADNIAGLKKAELAAEAEKRVAGKGWLPALLRSDMAAPASVRAQQHAQPAYDEDEADVDDTPADESQGDDYRLAAE